jgi:hypothetical protein
MTTHCAHQEFVIYRIKESFDIEIDHPVVPPASLAGLSYRLMG